MDMPKILSHLTALLRFVTITSESFLLTIAMMLYTNGTIPNGKHNTIRRIETVKTFANLFVSIFNYYLVKQWHKYSMKFWNKHN